MNATQEQISQELLTLLDSKVGSMIVEKSLELGDVVIRIKHEDLSQVFGILKLDTELAFDYFVSVTATDWMDSAEERYEVVYHLLSMTHKHRLRVKAWVPESDPTVDSAVEFWNGANFMEREVYDMYGIKFNGHPDLRRILMYDEFVGYPLRKDYPMQGKQPRIELRHPEVRNTAVDMQRPALVQINKKKAEDKSSAGGAA